MRARPREPFQLLIATILSAQATDVGVNKVTPGLFARFPDAEALAAADPLEVESADLEPGAVPQQGEEHRRLCSQQLVERHGGEVPGSMADLTALAGVGRKTANVVRSVAFGLPGLPVDTHVLRLSGLLGLTTRDRSGQGRDANSTRWCRRPTGDVLASG